ncbi:restriction endonuclease subunit S [Lactococcus lactis]|uniref:restriction endonuclease subunit S n=1 Tax=Lactococcus lactis TaxID=1358 RepID=UPI0014561A7C|nr:restriction endonuclease subunit S [Lactococcus lactis]MCT0438374.1 restriction endonuclease subunit S [Lactococcus lactis subsp. lactis]MCT2919187.1 restriction endonuclease subunit S [Lactococcus lactis]NLS46489.1 restriction endonuclease subunit S [Lactococcus lactis]
MSENKKLVPKRRFKEFENTDVWKQSELGEVLSGMYNGQTPSRFSAENWGGKINWLTSGELNQGVVMKTIEKITPIGQKDANLRVVPEGTFIMAITGLEAAGTRGSCARLGIPTTLNQSCMALFPKENLLDSGFLFQWYKKIGESYGLKYTQGTKQQSYNAELVKILPIILPNVAEQKEISNFLDNLDQTIAFQQRKLEKMKSMKSAYLSEMFPAEGERKPKRRFPGFTDDWEPRELGKTNTFFTDGNYGESYPKESDMSDSISGVPFLRGSDFKDGYLDSSEANFITKEKHSKLTSGHIQTDDIVLAVRGSLGTLGYATEANQGWNINSQLAIIRTDKQELLGSFLVQFLLSGKGQNELLSRNTGSALKQLPIKQLKDIPVPITSIEEQLKIGQFFTNLDQTIAFQQQKLEKLQNIKKAYLNEMFI